MANDKPIDLDSDNESENSVLYNATRKQSSVSPEDYPKAVRQDRAGIALPDKKMPDKKVAKTSGKIDPGPIRDSK
ncbi:hypothetical protein [Altericroceibacterium xinjiangense]|uniref:hypothetical protein n=1 Tax=Altericroceibacterium xinjiangense TaxID=762261 RepID=UPI000F7D60A2|nr:hypothetical protein [Altericroceibacterium xinjiangense]